MLGAINSLKLVLFNNSLWVGSKAHLALEQGPQSGRLSAMTPLRCLVSRGGGVESSGDWENGARYPSAARVCR